MRRKDKLVNDLGVLHDVIHKAQVCRLALVDNHNPYIIPLSFGFDGTHLYFHSATEGKKIDILKKNNTVCVEFEQGVELLKADKPCKWGVRYLTVIVNGTAEPVIDLLEKAYALNQIMRHYDSQWTWHRFSEQDLASVLVFKITIEEMTGKASAMTLPPEMG